MRRTVSLLAPLLATCVCAQPAADNGEAALDPAAAEARGFDYWLGRGVARDLAQAVPWLERAAAAGRPYAAALLASMYRRGDGVALDVERAHELDALAAAHGVAWAQAALARDFALAEDPADRDPAVVLPWLNAAAEQEEPFALYMLGQLYRFGDVIDQDIELGRRLVTRAAELGYPPAGADVAAFVLTGEPSAADVQRGVHFLRASAAGEVGRAAYLLGVLHLTGRYVQHDLALAVQWLTRASELEVPVATLRLADLYMKGMGVETDAARAAELRDQVLPKLPVGSLNEFAWELAVSPDAELRNGAFAVEIMEPVIAALRTPAYLDTLAAAYAEAGRFDEAVRMQQQAIDALAANAAAATLDDFGSRLELYRSGEPYREAP